MAESQRPAALYNISGEARVEFTLLDLRDRIRNGMLNPHDQIAIVGTDIWKPASDFPELRRYFSLLKPAAAPGAAAVTGGHAPAASMGRRIIAGVIYPFTGANADQGAVGMAGCLAGIAQVNAAGGALGHRFACKPFDTKGDPAETRLAHQRQPLMQYPVAGRGFGIRHANKKARPVVLCQVAATTSASRS